MIQLSSLEDAFSAGADLWVVSQPETSAWALKIDWELNFQILRGSRHIKASLPADLKRVMNETGLENTDFSESEKGLLVAADLNLPCRWVVCLSTWQVAEVHRTWSDLGRPSLRVFLPKGHSAPQFEKDWEKLANSTGFQIVLE